ncbi:MAG: L,D-transpeptidase [Actinobacteria bacterium]|nr:L,D-transpeptidase [Actinomycetota bacterium]
MKTQTLVKLLAPIAAVIFFGGVIAVAASGESSNSASATSTTSTTVVPTTTTIPVTTIPETTTTTAPGPTTTTVVVYSRENPRPVPEKSGTGRRIVYANMDNWVWIIEEDGTVALSVPVSGKKLVPKPKTYKVFSKSEFSQSIFFPEIKMKWSTRFAISPNGKNTIAFHEIPTCAWTGGHCNVKGLMQTEEQLGTFQSGGCIRMAARDAEFLFNWVEMGTKVVVLA